MFTEIPASKMSYAKRKPVLYVGINDANYIVQSIVNGKSVQCPYYQKWTGMLMRCYSAVYHKRYPTYIDCSVVKEWLTFSKFKAWMVNQDWQDKHLDKDILVQGNKIYSPDNCIFVTEAVNHLLCVNRSIKGKYPSGVSFCNRNKKYIAKTSINGKTKFSGYYDTPELAFDAYKKAKYAIIKDVALEQSEPLRSALLNYKIN